MKRIQTETIFIHTTLRSPERMKALLEAVDQADLVTLAFPLYVDTVPAPVIEALERIAIHRSNQDQPRPQRLVAIVNCGFPEAHHNDNALAVCETFAHQAGFDWAGGLAMGGGEMIHGAPLNELDGRVIRIKESLDLAAEALAMGRPIPQESVELMGKLSIPRWLYLISGQFGWKQQAKNFGADKLMLRRPYLVVE